jgi:hypothetical protein
MLLMLEDNAERVQRFRQTLEAIAPEMALVVWRDARTMIDEAGLHIAVARLISLDHDLEPLDSRPDPGDGLEVVKFLVPQPFICPVIIHTSNQFAADRMADELELAGWRYGRVTPLGDDWVEVDWLRMVKRLLAKRPRQRRRPRRA